jgi:hypothetical protein
MSFAQLTEEVLSLSYEDKFELKFLLERNLIEEQRKNYLNDFNESRKEISAGKVKYYSFAEELKKALDND